MKQRLVSWWVFTRRCNSPPRGLASGLRTFPRRRISKVRRGSRFWPAKVQWNEMKRTNERAEERKKLKFLLKAKNGRNSSGTSNDDHCFISSVQRTPESNAMVTPEPWWLSWEQNLMLESTLSDQMRDNYVPYVHVRMSPQVKLFLTVRRKLFWKLGKSLKRWWTSPVRNWRRREWKMFANYLTDGCNCGGTVLIVVVISLSGQRITHSFTSLSAWKKEFFSSLISATI